jgi:hypothetical protein
MLTLDIESKLLLKAVSLCNKVVLDVHDVSKLYNFLNVNEKVSYSLERMFDLAS